MASSSIMVSRCLLNLRMIRNLWNVWVNYLLRSIQEYVTVSNTFDNTDSIDEDRHD